MLYAYCSHLGRADEQVPLEFRAAEAMAEAAEALSQLHGRETRQPWRKCACGQSDEQTSGIRHGEAFMDNRHPLFWCRCFVGLLPPQRLCRADRGTRQVHSCKLQVVGFIVPVYKVHVGGRAQVQTVEVVFDSDRLTGEGLRQAQAVAAQGLMPTALAGGGVNEARELLRWKKLHLP